jgi:hypothetical protein
MMGVDKPVATVSSRRSGKEDRAFYRSAIKPATPLYVSDGS